MENSAASKLGRLYAMFMLALIFVSTASFMCESIPTYNTTPEMCMSGGQ